MLFLLRPSKILWRNPSHVVVFLELPDVQFSPILFRKEPTNHLNKSTSLFTFLFFHICNTIFFLSLLHCFVASLSYGLLLFSVPVKERFWKILHIFFSTDRFAASRQLYSLVHTVLHFTVRNNPVDCVLLSAIAGRPSGFCIYMVAPVWAVKFIVSRGAFLLRGSSFFRNSDHWVHRSVDNMLETPSWFTTMEYSPASSTL